MRVNLQKRIEKRSHVRLINFVEYFWDVLEPVQPFTNGWVLEGMCEHLEAVTKGQITHLLMNVMPGAMKSLLTDVFFPAWEWGPMGLAHNRFVAFSYAAHLTERDNAKFLSLLQSRKYQDMYGKDVELVEKGKVKVSNTRTGFKFASSVGGVGTGERGNRVILDDAHNIKEAESEAVRTETVRWVREAMSNRLNNMDTDAIIAIMQRSHESDASNTLIELDYEHFCVPMEFDGRTCRTSIGWTDPRTTMGELAWPERFSPAVVERTRRTIGPTAYAGQYQQTPEPRGGGIIKRHWWQDYVVSKQQTIPRCEIIVVSVDTAYTEKTTNDPTGCTSWGVYYDDREHSRLICLDAWRKHLEIQGDRALVDREAHEDEISWIARTREHWGLVENVAHTCKRWVRAKPAGGVHLLVEGKASGISVLQLMRKAYAGMGFAMHQVDPKGSDKSARLYSVQDLFADGMVYMPVYDDGSYRDWGEMLIREIAGFPNASHDDLTDSTSQALRWLRARGMLVRRDERAFEEAEQKKFRGRALRPLYDV